MVKHGLAIERDSSSSEVTSAPTILTNSGPSDSHSVLITSHKLNGQNFLQWSQSVRMFICGRGKEDYLTGEMPIPKKEDAIYKKWKAENHLIMSWLINSMNVDIGENFLLYETAQEIWEAVKATYSSSDNTSELFAIESVLHDLRQGDLSVTQYFNALTRQWQQLDMFDSHEWKCAPDNALYRSIVEQKRIFKFLLGLNKNLDEVRGRVMGTKPLPSLRESFSEVRREESRQKVMMGGQQSHHVPIADGSALASLGHSPSSHNDTRQPRKARPWCEHCSKPGHTKNTCWKIHGKPTDWKPSKPSSEKENRANVVTAANASPAQQTASNPFTREQLEMLQTLLNNTLSQQSSSSASMHARSGIAYSLSVWNQVSKRWIIDSGASDHMTGDKAVFCDYSPCPTKWTVRIADGTKSIVAGIGSVILSPSITLKSVLHVPQLDCNLISISQFTRDHNCSTEFFSKFCVFQELDSKKRIGSAEMCSGLYFFKLPQSSNVQLSHRSSFHSKVNKDGEVISLHYRLGHPSFLYLERLFPHLFINKNADSFSCEICQLAKHTRSRYPSTPYCPTTPFTLIHSDVWGPSRIKNINGARWFVTFVDDHTRLTWVFLMKEKSDIERIFHSFHSMIQTQFNTKIKIIKSDNAREYFDSTLGEFLSSQGIVQTSSCVNTPQQNGVAERKNRHLLEVARSIMFSTAVPKYLWGEAILTAAYLINRVPSRVLKFKSPHQVLSEAIPHVKFLSPALPLKIFGCTAFVHVYSQFRSKLDPKSLKCVFIGYSKNKKGYKCFCPHTKRVFDTMDVTFFENTPYFSKPVGQGEHEEPQLWSWESMLLESPTPAVTVPTLAASVPHTSSNPESHNPVSVPSVPHPVPSTACPSTPATEIQVYSRRHKPSQGEMETRTHQAPAQDLVLSPTPMAQRPTSRPVPECQTGIDVPVTEDLPIAIRKGTRSCTHHPIQRFVSYTALSQPYRAYISKIDEVKIPATIDEALGQPEWHAAVREEIMALEKNGTWTIVDLPPKKRVVSCKWLFTVKHKADGSVERFKARLVARGFTQSYGIDYQETFAPVAKLSTVRILLSLAANLDWPLHQLDIKNAFLHGDLEEEVYMEIPAGVQVEHRPGKACKLLKSLYGLKQSPRMWFGKFSHAVKEYGFTQCQADHTLFVKRSPENKLAILIVYVDDIVLTGDDEDELIKVKKSLAESFEVKDLGSLKYFLGMEIARSSQGIYVSQRKHTLDLLKETGMLGCRPAITPMESKKVIEHEYEEVHADKGRYQRLVGRLIYLTHTRPDIGFAVGMVSQFMNRPMKHHMEALYRILRYLKGTPGKGLLFKKTDERDIVLYSDADWAGSQTDRRSTTGYCSFVFGNLVTWRSKKQAVVSRSSAEAELRAVALTICEGIWIKRVMTELGIEFQKMVKLKCDNQATISMAKDPVHHDRTKHVEIDRHFISEKLTSSEVQLRYVSTHEQLADVLTKAILGTNFERICNKLGLYNMYNLT